MKARTLSIPQIIFWSLVATVAFEAATLIMRFGFGMTSMMSTASSVGWYTAGLRIHHGYLGIPLLILAAVLRSRRPVLVPWMIVVGVGLICSDLAHHFLVLLPLTGDPEFYLWYRPEDLAGEGEQSRRLLSWASLYYATEWIIRIILFVAVITEQRKRPGTGSTLAWLVIVSFLPWVGLVMYLLIGRRSMPLWRLERLARVPSALGPVIRRLESERSILQPEVEPELHPAIRLATSLGHFRVLGGNHAELLADYNATLTRLVADIDAAQDHVHLLFYIYADDPVADRVTQALARAEKRGVECRVLIDAYGSRSWLKKLLPKMRAAGIDAYAVLPVGLFDRKSARFDLRNHRKIAVIDGKVAYTGSQNIVDSQFKEDITYEELMVRLTGPVVLQLQFVFVADWYVETEEVLDSAAVFPMPEAEGEVPAQVLPSGPDFPSPNNQRLVVALLHGARDRVVITTPYFVPDDPLLQAMESAVHRGVKVSLIVSQKMDQRLVQLAQESYYRQLLDAGVKVYLYQGKFLHAKHLSVDDDVAFIGSSNMDIRSFELNAEVSVLFYDRKVTAALRAQQERYFGRCDRLSLDEWNGQGRWRRFGQDVARLMSPLL